MLGLNLTEDKKKSLEKVETKKKKGNKGTVSTASEPPVKGIYSQAHVFV